MSKIVFKNIYNNSFYNSFKLEDYTGINELEIGLIEMMNLNVSLRDIVYLVYDVRKRDNYTFFCRNMKRLSSRVDDTIDLHSFNLLDKIYRNDQEKIEFFS